MKRSEPPWNDGSLTTPKSGKGRRVDLSQQLAKTLRAWLVHSEAQKLRKGCKGLPPGSSVGVEGASLRKTDAFMEAHPFGEVSRVLETVGGGNTPPDSSPAASPHRVVSLRRRAAGRDVIGR